MKYLNVTTVTLLEETVMKLNEGFKASSCGGQDWEQNKSVTKGGGFMQAENVEVVPIIKFLVPRILLHERGLMFALTVRSILARSGLRISEESENWTVTCC